MGEFDSLFQRRIPRPGSEKQEVASYTLSTDTLRVETKPTVSVSAPSEKDTSEETRNPRSRRAETSDARADRPPRREQSVLQDQINRQHAAQQANTFLQMAQTALEQKDYETFLTNLNAAAELGDVTAFLALGNLCETGGCGVTKDLAAAERYYLAAIEGGAKEGHEYLDNLYKNNRKYFGIGKCFSMVLHFPVTVCSAIAALIAMLVFFFTVPVLLLLSRGNLLFTRVPEKVSLAAGGVLLALMLILFFHRFRFRYGRYMRRSRKVFEFIFSKIYASGAFVIAIAVGLILCIVEYRLLAWLRVKYGFDVTWPVLSQIGVIVIMVISGLFVFFAGYGFVEIITDTIKGKVHDYY